MVETIFPIIAVFLKSTKHIYFIRVGKFRYYQLLAELFKKDKQLLAGIH